MSDDEFGTKIGGTNAETEDLSSLTRYSSVTADLNTIFDLLSAARRRYLLYYLMELDTEVAEFEAAVDAVYKQEVNSTDSGDHATREEVRLDLHHMQIPKLVEAGVVDFDPRHGTIRYADQPALEEWVEHAHHKELD